MAGLGARGTDPGARPKVNRFNKRRDRALLLTDRHLYKLEPARQYRVMRAVPLDAVSLWGREQRPWALPSTCPGCLELSRTVSAQDAPPPPAAACMVSCGHSPVPSTPCSAPRWASPHPCAAPAGRSPTPPVLWLTGSRSPSSCARGARIGQAGPGPCGRPGGRVLGVNGRPAPQPHQCGRRKGTWDPRRSSGWAQRLGPGGSRRTCSP